MTDKKDELSAQAAEQISNLIRKNKSVNLGLPTGNTPLLMYQHLVKLSEQNDLDWSHVHCFALDEYLDSPPEHSFQTYLESNLYDKVGVPKANQHNPATTDNYDSIIKEHGGLNLTILGIGLNGHIAFNEPGTPQLSFTQCIWLQDTSRKALSKTFGSLEATPITAVTMGISTILASQTIVMLAFGADKKQIVEKAFANGVDPNVPASYLKLHGTVSVLTDTQ
ncbi:MAG: glucosamine-6-phosphate deaminase [Candidatus Melainabacteria bacterium]|nr:glucosamine-6-phosphate deaminase [Candidatus Melainabacteria bacterium]